jgi:hypothetical protein
MNRRSVAALVVTLGMGVSQLLGSAASATTRHGISRPQVKVSPANRLTNNQTIKISGSGLGKSKNGSIVTWFASECTTKGLGVKSLDPDFSPHCAVTLVKPLRVSPSGRFSLKFKVATGKVGDGDCGVPGHLTCLIAIGTATGRHATAKIKFKNITPAQLKTTTTTTSAATTTTKPKSK